MNRDTLSQPAAVPATPGVADDLSFENILAQWRDGLLRAFLRGSLIIGFFVVTLGVIEEFQNNRIYMGIIYGLVYLVLVVTALVKAPARTKALLFVSLTYILGVIILFDTGLHGDARLCFLAFPIFTFMLLGRRSAWQAFWLVVGTTIVFGVISFAGWVRVLSDTPFHIPMIYAQDTVMLILFAWAILAGLVTFQQMVQDAFQREQQLLVEQQLLERRVEERSRALQASFQVSQKLASLQDPQMLVVAVSEDIQRVFNYYHVHVYLLDSLSGDLVLAGGTGDTGQALVALRHKVQAGRGLVGRAAQTNQPVLVPDTAIDPGWLPNPLLPETRSELAVPITVGEKLLGVLDIQHNVQGGLSEQDIELLLSIANQLGVALQNAQQYAAAQRQAGREAQANQILQRLQAATTVEDLLQLTVRELGSSLSTDRAQIGLDLKRSGL